MAAPLRAGWVAGAGGPPPTPKSCPHQMDPHVEAQVVAIRRAHFGVGAAHDRTPAGPGGCGGGAG